MTKKHWTMIVPGAVLLCTMPAQGAELRDAVQAALNSNPQIRQAVANRAATQEERVQAQGLCYPRVSVEAVRRCSQVAQPDAEGPRHRRRHPLAVRRSADRRPVVVQQRRARSRNPPPGFTHRRRSGAGRGTVRICRAQRFAQLYRLFAAATAGRDRGRQCDVPPAARRRSCAKAWPRARSASPTSSRQKSACNRRAFA